MHADITRYKKPTGEVYDTYIASGEGWDAVSPGVTAGLLGNTGWNVVSGTWYVIDTGDGYYSPVVTTGEISRKATQFEGIYEWDWVKGNTDSTLIFHFISKIKGGAGAGQEGYALFYNNLEGLTFYRIDGASYEQLFKTGNALLTLGKKYRFRVIVEPGGIFSIYYSADNGANYTLATPIAGFNPKTDTTYTESNYINLHYLADDGKTYISGFKLTPLNSAI